jgi:hypothetical protein
MSNATQQDQSGKKLLKPQIETDWQRYLWNRSEVRRPDGLLRASEVYWALTGDNEYSEPGEEWHDLQRAVRVARDDYDLVLNCDKVFKLITGLKFDKLEHQKGPGKLRFGVEQQYYTVTSGLSAARRLVGSKFGGNANKSQNYRRRTRSPRARSSRGTPQHDRGSPATTNHRSRSPDEIEASNEDEVYRHSQNRGSRSPGAVETFKYGEMHRRSRSKTPRRGTEVPSRRSAPLTPPPEIEDFENWRTTELRERLKGHGINASRMTKKEMVEKLQNRAQLT